jgi:hypothetical protein
MPYQPDNFATQDFVARAFSGKRPEIEMHVGRPVELPPISSYNLPRKEALQHNTDLVMAALARLLPQSYRGYYADYVS